MNVTRDIPVYRHVDVCVVGGGPGGICAALAAARNGADTMLIERSQALGGNMTLGLIQSVHGYRSDNNYGKKKFPASDWSNPLVVKTPVAMDLYNQILLGGGTAFPERINDPGLRENIDEEVAVYVIDKMMKQAGVHVLFNTFAYDVIMEDSKVTGVMIANKSGPQIVKAGVVIDCSADADISYMAGAECTKGMPEDGKTHGIALQMEIGGIDIGKFTDFLKNKPELTAEEQKQLEKDKEQLTNGGCKSSDAKLDAQGKQGKHHMEGKHLTAEELDAAIENGLFFSAKTCVDAEWMRYLKEHPYPETPYRKNTDPNLKPMYPRAPFFNWYGLVRNGKVRYDQTMAGVFECFVDCTDEEALSDAIIRCREVNWIYMKFFREYVPGFEDAYIIKTGTYGGRESRQVVGEYVLTIDDIAAGVVFDDTIAFTGRANNLHHINGQYGFRMWMEAKKIFTVPYRCLVPKQIDNLLVGGRCISKDYLVRVSSMVPCMSFGEAAGAAAAVAIKHGVRPRDVDVREVQEILGIDLENMDMRSSYEE